MVQEESLQWKIDSVSEQLASHSHGIEPRFVRLLEELASGCTTAVAGCEEQVQAVSGVINGLQSGHSRAELSEMITTLVTLLQAQLSNQVMTHTVTNTLNAVKGYRESALSERSRNSGKVLESANEKQLLSALVDIASDCQSSVNR